MLEVGVYENIPVVSSQVEANQAVLLVLQVLSGIITMVFTFAFAYIVHHRIKKHVVSPKIPDSVNTSKFDSMEAVTEDSFILENTIVLTESNQINGGTIKNSKEWSGRVKQYKQHVIFSKIFWFILPLYIIHYFVYYVLLLIYNSCFKKNRFQMYLSIHKLKCDYRFY